MVQHSSLQGPGGAFVGLIERVEGAVVGGLLKVVEHGVVELAEGLQYFDLYKPVGRGICVQQSRNGWKKKTGSMKIVFFNVQVSNFINL
jgi:hypothetical protein